MAITLTELAANSNDKLVQGFTNEVVTDSFLLGAMPFDDCMTASGTSDLIYSYKRVKTPAVAAFRALGAEPAASVPKTEKKTTRVAILSNSWNMDRVAKDAASDLYELYLEESKNAIIRKFNQAFISGDTTSESEGFDGLAKALNGSSTESTSKTDLSVVTQAAALAYLEELDTMLSGLMRTPDALVMGSAQRVKLNACLRAVGLGTQTMETAGRQVPSYNGIAIHEMRDGAVANGDVYACCFGLDALHGVTLSGGSAVSVTIPDWSTPGAVKSGDCELVCGIALKATKAAGVLHAKAA